MRHLLTTITLCLTASGAFAQDRPTEVPRSERVLTREERAAMTPADVLRLLQQGNREFVAGALTDWSHPDQVRKAAAGQYPKALVLSCLDSRIPVEVVFNLGIGDLFVARIAGNFENTDILGSMEFASIHDGGDGVRLIVVLGHGSCGAIGHAIDRTRVGNIGEMLDNIEPAIRAVGSYEGERTSSNAELMERVTVKNVEITVADIRRRSPMLKALEDEGRLQIVGALYDIETGEVTFLPAPE